MKEEYQEAPSGNPEAGYESEDAYEEGIDEDIPAEAFGAPEQKQLGGLYALFDEVLNRPLTTRVSNLSSQELGDLGITVRDSYRIALLAETFRHPVFAKFFLQQSNIITSSAMSRKGWFSELFVSSKKFASRETQTMFAQPEAQGKKKWGLIKRK